MDHDDRQLGRILSRREVLALFGAAGAVVLTACGPGQANTRQPQTTATAGSTATAPPAPAPTVATAVATTAATPTTGVAAVPACVVRPEVTEGPYYVNEDLHRSDIRTDPGTGAARPGAPLTLAFSVAAIGNGRCTPLPGAKVEVWHCDAAGVYSDVTDRSFNTKGQRFLRGYQLTDANGRATFTTIYPGWYAGRAIHIHFKIHPTANTVFTSQLFFDDALSDQVLAQPPYASKGRRDTPNSRDGIYKSQLIVPVSKADQGYVGTFDIGVQQG